MTTLTLKKGHEKRLQTGHLWVFSNELAEVPHLAPGSLVEVQGTKRSFGTGMYNPNSLIAVRLLQTVCQELSADFFIERIRQAYEHRCHLFPPENSYRLIFGESDILPGLIIDRYGDYFALQIMSAGMEVHRSLIIEALLHLFPDTKGIVEKNISHLRELEGLEMREGIVWGDVPDEILIQEHGITFALSVLEGQKTGYFLDQKVNREVVRSLAQDRRVLDCFTNQGSFALHAALGGAKHVCGIDISSDAVRACRRNAELNGCTNIHFEEADVFDALEKEAATGRHWDFIILDPPAFTRSRKQVPAAKKGYARLNRLALRLLSSGGYLATGSCSHHIYEETFLEIISEQARLEGKQLRLVFRGMQSPDHPVLMSMPETQYLKFFIFEVLSMSR